MRKISPMGTRVLLFLIGMFTFHLLSVLSVNEYQSAQLSALTSELCKPSIMKDLEDQADNKRSSSEKIHTKVVIGAVFCRDKALSSSRNKYGDVTITMLKSVILSARFNNISTVDIHLFLEHPNEDEFYFKDRLHRLGLINKELATVNVTLRIHSALDAVPKEYHDHMIYDRHHRCSFVRMFFPTALQDVDSIIYLDNDVVVTGNIMKHWQELDKMKRAQMISIGYNRQPQNFMFPEWDKAVMESLPHVPPKGVNTGVLIMNLTKMREFDWEEKVVGVYDVYSKIMTVDDQIAINVLLFYNPTLYQITPCHLHFLYNECERGWFCPEATNDTEGVHLVHGAAKRFSRGGSFFQVYEKFREFDPSSATANFYRDVVFPLRDSHEDPKKTTCQKTLGKHLFKQFESTESKAIT